MPKEELVNIDDAPVDEPVVDEDQDTDVVEDIETEDDHDAEPPEVKEEDETDDDSDAEEYVDDFKEWAAQFEGMPDGIDSEEKLAEAYISSLKEMKRGQTSAQKLKELENLARTKGFDNVDAFLAGNVTAQPQPSPAVQAPVVEGDTYFTPNPVKAVIESMIKEGAIPQDNVGSYNAVAKVVDQAITPQFQRADQALAYTISLAQRLEQTVKKLEWDAVPESVRGSVDRAEVDRLVSSGAVGSMDEAIQFLHFKNPDLLKKIAQKAEEKGVEKGRKKLRRSGSIKRGKGQPSSRKWDYAKYQNEDGDWDDNRLASLSFDDRDKMLDDFLKENFKK